MDLKAFKKKLIQISKKKGLDQQMALLEVLFQVLEMVGIKPILVGGAAVAYYTQGAYVTSDIDLVSPTTEVLINTMEALGFKKLGKDFVHHDLDFYVEFPGSDLGPTEKFDRFYWKGKEGFLRVISLEDLIIDRVNAFKFWHSEIDGVSALMLLEQGSIDEERLLLRAKEESSLDALQALRDLREKSIRLKLSKKKSGELLKQLLRKIQ